MEMPEKETAVTEAIIGKTYSLYCGETSSAGFYQQLRMSADLIIDSSDVEPAELLLLITHISSSKRRIRISERKEPLFCFLVKQLRKDLNKYLVNVEEHLKSISFRERWDTSLGASADQYLLYMLEIEITNRIYKDRFSSCSVKMAFLPHCLRDFSRECLSSPDSIDFLCRRCSKKCKVNMISQLLKESEIKPYIWLQADLKKIFKIYKERSETIGVLGIACIPELAKGMRLCRNYNIPVVGVPLDANRCRRWLGDFYDNSVNIDQLCRLTESV